MKRIILIYAALFGLGSLAAAQWGPRGFSTAGPQLRPLFAQTVFAQPIQNPASEWRYAPGDTTSMYLYKHGVQLGGYNYQHGYWRDYDVKTDTWGDRVYCDRLDVPKHIGKKKADTKAPAPPQVEVDGTQNFGVDWQKIEGHGATYAGLPISNESAKRMIENEIPDHKQKFHLVVIGTEAERKGVIDQLAQLEPQIAGRVLPRSVKPGEFSLKDSATGQTVYKDGNPSVYFQAPDGKVLHRQADGANVVDAIRKAVKHYDADKDPDMRKPQPGPLSLPGLPSHPAIIPAIGMAALALFALLKGQK